MDRKAALLFFVALQCLYVAQASNPIENPEEIRAAYETVRSDLDPTIWVMFGYDTKQIIYLGSGVNYNDFLNTLQDDKRIYVYVRFQIGERAKFAFITWIGRSVPPLKKAKVSTDKAYLKQIVAYYQKEILADEKSEVQYEKVKEELERASGAAYDGQSRREVDERASGAAYDGQSRREVDERASGAAYGQSRREVFDEQEGILI